VDETLVQSDVGRRSIEPEEFQQVAAAVEREVASVIVGQQEAVWGALICLVVGRHALLEGVPGLGKTTLVRTFSQVLCLRYGRIQFTPDLMPADITGTNVLTHEAGRAPSLTFQPGPVFVNLLLADEINRATPKTQSALLEAMEEATVTIGTVTRELPRPFCVLATQNPIEMQGTYPLPEAQLDRFFLKLRFELPSRQELRDIVLRTVPRPASPSPATVIDTGGLLAMGELARTVPMAPHVVDYASRLTLALHPGAPGAPEMVGRFVRYGPSPRGTQTLCRAGQVVALLDGRYNLAYRDVRRVAGAALRHRVVLNFEAEREGISSDTVIDRVLAGVPEEPG
jgi:MoxR-like ATPase